MEGEFYHKDIFGTVVDANFGEDTEEKAPISSKKGKFFPDFAFTDAITDRNKKEAWIQYRREVASGLAPEQLFWSVSKQIKNLILAKETKNATEAGLNPFVYSKLKKGLKNYNEGELEHISEALVDGYHDARRGKGEIETLIERILLSL